MVSRPKIHNKDGQEAVLLYPCHHNKACETPPPVTLERLRADNSRGAAAAAAFSGVFTIINLMMHPLLGDKSPTFSKMQQTASQATIAKHVPCYRGACYKRNSYPI